MSRPRRLASAVAAAAVLALLAPVAAAAPRVSLGGLLLSGEDTCGFKTVYAAPATFLFAPLELIDADFTSTKQRLLPYQVEIVGGEGLKARHLSPGDVFTRPGKAPRAPVVCDFTVTTKDDDEVVEIQITGSLLGR